MLVGNWSVEVEGHLTVRRRRPLVLSASGSYWHVGTAFDNLIEAGCELISVLLYCDGVSYTPAIMSFQHLPSFSWTRQPSDKQAPEIEIVCSAKYELVKG